jgi:hypothetical protein
VLEFYKVLHEVLDFLMLFAVDLSKMVDLPLLFLKVISDAGVLILVRLELLFEGLILNRKLINVALNLADFTIDFTISAFIVPDSLLDAF